MKHYTNKARQAGMTLIELTVVLLVLVGLAGLLIPYVSGFVTKTHDSTGASNIQALNNAVQRYAVEHYDNYPDKLDSLIEDYAGTPVPFSKMMSTSFYSTLTLDTAKALSLTKAGINTVREMDPSTDNATFNNTNNDISIADTVEVLEIDTVAIPDLAAVMGKPLDTVNNHYIVFGLGDDSTIAGQTVSDVPVHFASNANMGANNRYNHFVLVFEVPKAAYCVVGAFSAGDYTLDVTNEAGTLTALLADTAAGAVAAPANQGDCDTGAAAFLLTETATEEPLDVANVASFSLVNPGSSEAKFIGSAMSMMSAFEGLGGSMNRYYENTATN